MDYDFDNLTNLPEAGDVASAAEGSEIAIQWQEWAANQDLSYGELAEWQIYFLALADKYPVLREEFLENGII